MKKNVILLVMIIACLSVTAQNYSKGDFLFNADAQVAEIHPDGDISPDVWEGTQWHLSVNYIFFQTKPAAVSTGLHTSYFRHQPRKNEDFGTVGIAIPVTVHIPLINKLDSYIGYRAGYYFDQFEAESESIVGQYEGLYSEAYLGFRYFIVPRFAVFSEVTTTELKVNAGVTFKL